MTQAIRRYACRRCGRAPVEKWALCTPCVDWWEELVGRADGQGIAWNPEETAQASLGDYDE